MASRPQYVSRAKDSIDAVQVRTLYLIKHVDKERLAMLDEMRKHLRDALNILECSENPTAARSRRIAAELKMTGLEQVLEA